MVPFYLEPFSFSKDWNFSAKYGYVPFVTEFVFVPSSSTTTFLPMRPLFIAHLADKQIFVSRPHLLLLMTQMESLPSIRSMIPKVLHIFMFSLLLLFLLMYLFIKSTISQTCKAKLYIVYCELQTLSSKYFPNFINSSSLNVVECELIFPRLRTKNIMSLI